MKKTENIRRVSAADARDLTTGWLWDPEPITNGEFVEYPADVERPRTRAECEDGPRPCPWVSCRFHLALDVNPQTGAIKLNYPGLPIEYMAWTCALDVAEQAGPRGLPLEHLAAAMGLSYDRAHQVVVEALKRAREVAAEEGAELEVRPSLHKRKTSEGEP